jgi:hypothetical protein
MIIMKSDYNRFFFEDMGTVICLENAVSSKQVGMIDLILCPGTRSNGMSTLNQTTFLREEILYSTGLR